jgi:hypothetical protein
MKQPRTSDFDPNAKSRDLKSPMMDLPAIERPGQAATTEDRNRTAEPPGRPDRPGRVSIPTATGRRKIKSRHAFDVYEDQVEALQQLSLEDRMRGGVGSMSAMVREALDDYIAKVRAEERLGN